MFEKTDSLCFDFWYHMKGITIGELNIYQTYTDNKQEKKLWSLNGNQGDIWYRAAMPITSDSDFYLIIEGIAGSGYFG